MKRLLIILFFLPLATFAQIYIGQPKVVVHNKGAFKTDSVFTLPVRDTSFPAWLGASYKAGSIVMKGTTPYYYNGTSWRPFSSGSGSTFDSTYIYQALDDTAADIRADIPSLTGYMLKSDSTIFASYYQAGLRVKYTDTSSMLTPYARKASPVLTTPTLGVASATSVNTGTTLNGVIFAKSTTDIDLTSTTHGLTVGGESNSTNLAIGEYGTGTGLQSRNNGAIGAIHFNPYSGDVRIGSAYAGAQHFTIFNTDAGTGSYIEMGLRNSAGSADALLFRTLGTGFTTSGMNTQDGAMIGTSTSLLGGLSIGTQASADLRLYTNNTLRWTMAGATGNVSTTGQFTSSGGGIGYETGAGGTVTQLTSRTTAVTLNKLCGNITMFSAAQAINAMVTFTLTNSYIAAGDYLLVQHISATNGGAWGISTVTGAGSATISIRNNTTASITEATPLKFFILKATTN